MKKILNKILIIFVFLMFICATMSNAAATEKIYTYSSDIYIHEDASMTVEETIEVYAAGINIKRGIYRDFPTKYKDKKGNNYTVKFEVLEVLKDGKSEPYRLENQRNGVRVYIGDANKTLNPGIYTYTIKYKTDRQIGYFDDHDELYWNVTGNGWEFPMDKVRATVHLPENADVEKINYEAYTGYQGSTEKKYNAYKNEDGTVEFYTTEKLEKGEGLTIVVGFEKGLVHEPTFEEKLAYFFEDNKGVLIGLIGAVIIAIYGYITWAKYGKDPKKDVIIPRYNTPEGFSPAEVKYLDSMGGYSKAFEATILNLAVNGYLKIESEKKKFGGTKITLIKSDKILQDDIGEDEKNIYLKLPDVTKLEYNSSLQRKLESMQTSQQKRLKDKMNKKMFTRNSKFVGIALILTIIDLIVTFITSSIGEYGSVAVFMLLWLSIWTCGVASIIKTKGKSKFILLIPFGLFEIMGIIVLLVTLGLGMSILIAVLAAINVIYIILIRAYTVEGRKIEDEIEGFKLFIKTASEDEIKAQTPETFDKYFPYAYALGLENEWAKKFESLLNSYNYEPTWCSGFYVGSAFNVTSFTSSFSSGLSSSISSASTAPGSSSGFSGGGRRRIIWRRRPEAGGGGGW